MTTQGHAIDRVGEPAGTLVPPKVIVHLSRKRLGMAMAGLIVGLGVAWAATDWWTKGRFIESTDDAYVGGDITVMAPKVAGLIAEVAIVDNQTVRAGDLLVRLDDRDYRAAVAKADASVAEQQATLDNLDATHRLQISLIAEANAGVAATGAEVARSRLDQVRYRELSENAAASIQAFQKANTTYQQAVAADSRARAALTAARQQLDVIDTQKQRVAAQLAAVIAEQSAARLNLGYTEVRAPIDGTVGNRSARVGAYAGVGAPLTAIVPAHGLWVDANFKENQLADLKAGLAATITADVLPGRVFHGHVASLAPATGAEFSVLPAENATGNFTRIVQRVPVRIALDDDAAVLDSLRPGLSVTVDVDERRSAGKTPRGAGP